MDKITKQFVIQAMGYTDCVGQARAATLLQQASSRLWKQLSAKAKAEWGDEIKQEIANLRSSWNSNVAVSNAAIRNAVAKVLIRHQYPAYPEIICGILGSNPYQDRWTIPDYVSKPTHRP